MFSATFQVLDEAISNFKKRPEVQNIMRNPLFTEDELNENKSVSLATHNIVLETNFSID